MHKESSLGHRGIHCTKASKEKLTGQLKVTTLVTHALDLLRCWSKSEVQRLPKILGTLRNWLVLHV